MKVKEILFSEIYDLKNSVLQVLLESDCVFSLFFSSNLNNISQYFQNSDSWEPGNSSILGNGRVNVIPSNSSSN